MPRYCTTNNCTRRALYGDTLGTKCSDHKTDNMKMINYQKKKECKVDNCTFIPSYNFSDKKNGVYCSIHKLKGMVNVISKRCFHENCNKRPSFNFENEVPIYCYDHKLDGMVNVANSKCHHENCSVKPSFNYIDQNQGLYCSKHKLENMVNVVNNRCEFQDCNVKPGFNYEKENYGLYCNKHKLEGMVDVINRKCAYENCSVIPIFNYPEEIKGIYCNTHKLKDMINVVNEKCHYDSCSIRPIYNYVNEKKGIYCNTHKLVDMVDVVNLNKICKFNNCVTRASFNFDNEKNGIYCNLHKLEGMKSVTHEHQECLSELCMIRATTKYKGYCVRCYMHLFPDEKISRNYKIKEKYVTDYLQEIFPDLKFIFDKMTEGCSKRRPDVYIDLLTHIIIVECDENQHKKYDTTCEEMRINELYEDFACRPIVFIRFNPDDYIDKHGNDIKSCFTLCKTTNIQIITRKKKTEWKLRLDALKKKIIHHVNNIPEHSVWEYLYYDS
jgi:hypothetical protein